jgi:hypothetical protein
LDFLQQTITMNENAQWQMIKDSVLFALSSGFFVSLYHFYLKKKSDRGRKLQIFYPPFSFAQEKSGLLPLLKNPKNKNKSKKFVLSYL